ncbi:MAG: HAD-IB family hydrolase [Caulobacterales bacterium]
MTAPQPKPAPRIVAFDLDGTLTTKDTLTQFLIWRAGVLKAAFIGILLIPYALAYALRLLNRGQIKQAALRRFIKGVPAETLEMDSKRFAAKVLPRILRPAGVAALRAHVAAGDRVLLVTASPEFVPHAWAQTENLELVATRMQVHKGRVTGRLEGLNCRGPEKVRRLGELLGEAVRLDLAYGDSDGDTDMLAAAETSHFRLFKDRP